MVLTVISYYVDDCGLLASRLSGDVKEDPSSSEQKHQDSYILLSDSSEQVSVVVARLCVLSGIQPFSAR